VEKQSALARHARPDSDARSDVRRSAVHSFIREQAGHARYVFSLCTGALICGAAGLLEGVRATTHEAAFDLLKYFGAIPVDERVVDANNVSAAGL